MSVNIRILNIIKLLFYIYLLVYIFLSIIPASSAIEAFYFNLYLNFSFLFFSIFTALMVLMVVSPKNHSTGFKLNINYFPEKYLNISFFFSIIGFFLILYDRVVTRGIDYTSGLRAARYLWLDSEGGNIIGILGNILNSFGYYSLVAIIINKKKIPIILHYKSIISVIFCVIGLALLNGGRANILIAIFLLLIAVVISKTESIEKAFYRNLRVLIRIIPFLILPVVFVTISSASLGNLSMRELFELEVAGLYGKSSDPLPYYGQWDSIVYTLDYMIAYLMHGQWTASYSRVLHGYPPFYTFYPLLVLLNNFVEIDNLSVTGFFSDTGAFISLPGALYYDFGFIGHIVGSLFFGLLLSVVFIFLQKGIRITGIKLAYVLIILLTFFMSPLTLAYGFSITTFIIVPFVFFNVYSKLKVNIN
jgi:hypothetical protein